LLEPATSRQALPRRDLLLIPPVLSGRIQYYSSSGILGTANRAPQLTGKALASSHCSVLKVRDGTSLSRTHRTVRNWLRAG